MSLFNKSQVIIEGNVVDSSTGKGLSRVTVDIGYLSEIIPPKYKTNDGGSVSFEPVQTQLGKAFKTVYAPVFGIPKQSSESILTYIPYSSSFEEQSQAFQAGATNGLAEIFLEDLIAGKNSPFVTEILTPLVPSTRTTKSVKTKPSGEWSAKINMDKVSANPAISVSFEKKEYDGVTINNIQKSPSPEDNPDDVYYSIPRITLTPQPTEELKKIIIQKILAKLRYQEVTAAGIALPPIPFPISLALNFDLDKEEIKKTLIAAALSLVAIFGPIALQYLLSQVPMDQIVNKIKCPKKDILKNLIPKRNKLVKDLNRLYKKIDTLNKQVGTVNGIITGVRIAIAVLNSTLPPLQTAAQGLVVSAQIPQAERLNDTTNRLGKILRKSEQILGTLQPGVTLLSIVIGSIAILLTLVIKILEFLDLLIRKCSEEQDLPFEEINSELNDLVNTSTGISNSDIIGDLNSSENNKNNTYKGFTLEIKLDEANNTKYPLRFAQALNVQGVPVLKTKKSFASDPQVLLDELKFIIDSNPQLTAR